MFGIPLRRRDRTWYVNLCHGGDWHEVKAATRAEAMEWLLWKLGSGGVMSEKEYREMCGGIDDDE